MDADADADARPAIVSGSHWDADAGSRVLGFLGGGVLVQYSRVVREGLQMGWGWSDAATPTAARTAVDLRTGWATVNFVIQARLPYLGWL